MKNNNYSPFRTLLDDHSNLVLVDLPARFTVNMFAERIHRAGKTAMADISTLEEGIKCAELGADIISTTLSGYTLESGEPTGGPDFELLSNLVKRTDKPIVLEGRIWTPEDVRQAFLLGAHSVVIGSAITRPQLITKRFIEGAKG